MNLYHHTDQYRAREIFASKSFRDLHGNRDGAIHFSNRRHGFYASEYGEYAVHVSIPQEYVTEVTSYRDGEKYYTVKGSDIMAFGSIEGISVHRDK